MGPKFLIISLLIVLGTVAKQVFFQSILKLAWLKFIVLCPRAKLVKDWPFDTSKPETFEFGQYHTYDEVSNMSNIIY